MLTTLRSSLFLLGQVVITVAFALLLPLALLLPYRWRYTVLIQWGRAILLWLRLTCGIRHVIEGLDRIPADNAIILANHQSAWETLMLPLLFRPQSWLLKRELLRIPLFGWGLALMRPIAIDRSAGRKAMRQLLTQGQQRLEQGCWVVIFPQGTRVAPGEHKPYAVGGALLAERSGYPVVPVAHNAGYCWGRHAFHKHPGTIRLVIGEPIDTTGLDAQAINQRVAAWIEAEQVRIGDPRAG